ncbi:MAG: GNAT family N-acetyltransferase, partial [Kiritimatiellae bacterium]|nr:GNAT family N-acetyltransferase [Kiritimatiellia bacterium]
SALRHLRAELYTNPSTMLDEWWKLYQQLCQRHGISGIAAFSKGSFAKQMIVPGMVAFTAWDGSELAGMSLWYRAGDVAYYHLNACNHKGYRSGASYALMWVALEHWQAEGIRWAALGAGSGLKEGSSGLEFFKKGWSTGIKTAWFGGVIFRQDVYARLSEEMAGTSFFPAYRGI